MKLTENQLRVLATIANNRGAAHTVYALGRGTCEALRKRGLIEGDKPFSRWNDGNPFIHITDAGRAALQERTNG
jgi:hypothetical protein